jgi:hypothetical protein
MRDNLLRGRYAVIDFNADILINKTDESYIKKTFNNLINEKKNIYKFRYAQGFLDVDDPESIGLIPKLLDKLSELLEHALIFGVTIQSWITSLFKQLEKVSNLSEDLLDYIWEIFDKFETIMYFKDLKQYEPYLLKLISSEPQYLFELPNHVQAIIYEARPCSIEIDILESKSKRFVVSKEHYKVGRYYKISKYDLGILPGLSLNVETVKSAQRGKFKLGLNINNVFQIPKDLNIDPDFIIVEPEKAYIPTSGIAYLDQRQTFYKHLFAQYPKSEIIVSLPKLLILDIYFNQGNITKLNHTSMLNHSAIYEIELSALFKYNKDHILLSIPDIECVHDFDRLKKDLQLVIQRRFQKVIKIGLDINNEYTANNLQDFKGYHHAVINLNKRFDLVLPSDLYSATYAKSYSDLRNILYRKSKDVYLVGQDIHQPVFLQKMIYRGFKNFAVKPELFDLCSMIIYRYNQGERLYAKSA